MELKDFVAETLSQIVEGVKNAQSEAKTHGAIVNPVLAGSTEYGAKHGILATRGGAAHLVQFDVALTTTEGTGTRGGIGVFTGAINLGTTGQSKSENTTVSRIQFSVPVALPKNE